ncbi:hypothetical protein SAMN05660380_02075 [Xylella fastidiosa]|jgi:hypothetical protein|nr:hypothetical protein SAMN05660380_02075 [Xylella fastidiosa]
MRYWNGGGTYSGVTHRFSRTWRPVLSTLNGAFLFKITDRLKAVFLCPFSPAWKLFSKITK